MATAAASVSYHPGPSQGSSADLDDDGPAESAEPPENIQTPTFINPPNLDNLIKHKEIDRLKSFPPEWRVYNSKSSLAKEGFYYSLSHFICICAFCRIELDAKDNFGQNLRERHKSLSPNCDFANGRETNNIPLGNNITNYRYELHRLITFLVTNWSAPVDIYDLAKWGFYHTGTEDVGRCHFCRLEVRGWEQGDTGYGEHRRWNPNCPFLQNRHVGNVALGSEEEHLPNQDLEPRDRIPITYPPGVAHLSGQELGVTATRAPRHPEYATRQVRLQSYNMWPRSLSQRPEELSEAGFYYTGRGDRTVCFQCGGGLKDWGNGDQPWTEHALWFPDCPFLNLMKGRDFINQVQRARDEQNRPTNLERDVPSTLSGEAVVTSLQDSQSVPPPSPRMDFTRTCKVCLIKELGVVILPCGHLATCPECVTQLTSCPICRGAIKAYVRAFLP